MLSDGKWSVNGVCMTWQDRGAEGPERVVFCLDYLRCLSYLYQDDARFSLEYLTVLVV